MTEELNLVLNELRNNGTSKLHGEFKMWSRLTDKCELRYNSVNSKFILFIRGDEIDGKISASTFHISHDRISYLFYEDILYQSKNIKNVLEFYIPTGMRSEEEYFQNSTIENFGNLDYSDYKIIQDIVDVISTLGVVQIEH